MKTVVSSANTNVVTSASNTTNAAVSKPDANLAATADSNLQFQTPSSTASSAVLNGTKRPISLDLNKAIPAKAKRLVAPSPLLLDSPDLQNMKTLNTPDLEKILLSSNLLQTPQPGLVFPAKVGPVTSEQEAFGKGFEEALHSLHNSKNNNGTSAGNGAAVPAQGNNTNAAGTSMSGGSFTYTNLETFPVAIKDEPQNPSSSPPVSPIDMETQEKIKLERKRQRNRVAASKCRKRKLERISKLEEKVKVLKGENTDLGSVVKNLKDHVAQLKQQVIEHIETGCSISTIYNGSALLQSK